MGYFKYDYGIFSWFLIYFGLRATFYIKIKSQTNKKQTILF